MSVALWRIAADTPRYAADDLSGNGAKATGGRWNALGQAMVYASVSRAMACLETMVHLNASGLPMNRYLVEISVPDALWGCRPTRNRCQRAGGLGCGARQPDKHTV